MTDVDRETMRLIWYLFAGPRRVENRIRIIEVLKKKPHNINQLAKILGVDYKGVQHYIGVLEKNNTVAKLGEKYGAEHTTCKESVR
jgi:predicted transcriptional regulator